MGGKLHLRRIPVSLPTRAKFHVSHLRANNVGTLDDSLLRRKDTSAVLPAPARLAGLLLWQSQRAPLTDGDIAMGDFKAAAER
jgi:hypothetical protein